MENATGAIKPTPLHFHSTYNSYFLSVIIPPFLRSLHGYGSNSFYLLPRTVSKKKREMRILGKKET